MIRLEGIHKIYRMGTEAVHALQDVNLHIGANEFVAIVGPSGSGKSTMMNILGCLDSPTRGEYTLAGEEVSRLGEDQLADVRNRRIGFIFQSFNLLPKLTALQNVELPMIYAGVPPATRRQRAIQALRDVGLMERANHHPNEMSGGQRQRVAIARALVNNPSILLADEPTGNLDSKTGDEIMAAFHRLHRDGKTIVLVTHEPEIAQQALRIVAFRDGRIVDDRKNGVAS
ncbi:ATP-binding cassette domain-containing protein [Heliobacterium gestii]|uniref:ATP-binding cassette domain-containing protein n=1 Tax=Heliomicrobium gestii TaxID=2699 RepID=A0A845L9F1_HELGE|nr:ABC transporter ATP-binding protein [Heliomicrobium gestii]MBM7865634.1 putative ABC transport system ATP-binding protein [Heliomicrobium gestii]MZP41884.1 ATP-binding cassette domain-containing protein [Heliomicrobium gestii]